MRKNSRYKIKNNLGFTPKKAKVKKKGSIISKETNIKNLIKCLDEGNLVPVRNYLKSLLPKKKVTTSISTQISSKRELIESYRKELIAKETKAEKLAKTLLKEMKVKFTFQQDFICKNGKFYFIDFYFPLLKVGIEIDGGYHLTSEQVAKDNDRTKNLEKNGVDIYRFTNKQVFGLDEFRNGIREILNKYS